MYNKVILIGNLGKDPEIRYLESGRSVAEFSMATSKRFKNKFGENITDKQWHKIVMWSPLAPIAEKYLSKGSKVQVEGELIYRSYETKEGEIRYVTEVVAFNILMLDSKSTSKIGKESGTDYSKNNDFFEEGGTP